MIAARTKAATGIARIASDSTTSSGEPALTNTNTSPNEAPMYPATRF